MSMNVLVIALYNELAILTSGSNAKYKPKIPKIHFHLLHKVQIKQSYQ